MSQPVDIDRNNISKILAKYDHVLLDCDGVVWGKDHMTPIPGVAESISTLREQGKRVLFVTNNSMHGRDSYLNKFRKLAGFEANKEDVFGVAYAAAIYLKDVAPVKGRCYLIGEKGFAQEFDEAGIPHVGVGPDCDPPTGNPERLMQIELAEDIGAVVVGYDEHFSFNKLFKAASYLSTPGCMYVATNDVERGVQLAPGRRQPIAGALTAAVSAAAKRQPIVLGKPYHYFIDCIKTKISEFNPSKTLMVGDSLKTDIPFASRNGMDSMLVLTGVSHQTDIKDAPVQPTYVAKSLAEIGEFCKK